MHPLPGPLARQYPFPWHMLDLDPVKPRPDFTARPNRDGISTEKGLLTAWPKGGPKLLWSVEGLGEGYSTPSVANGKLYVLPGTKSGARPRVYLGSGFKGYDLAG